MNVDYLGLLHAYQDTNIYDHDYWLDLETGNVILVDRELEKRAEPLDGLDETEDRALKLAWCVLWEDGEVGTLENEDEDERKVKALLETFVGVPQRTTHEDYELMVEFAATVEDPHLRDLLEVALKGRGAFRRFKDVVSRDPDERQRWFDFREEHVHREIDTWLDNRGLLAQEEQD
jgi:hypothetical protein